MHPDDHELIARCRSGDDGAMQVLFERHHKRVYAMALRLTGSVADAEDVVQDTFVRALRGLKSFRGDAAVSTWLTRIAINLTRDLHKKKSRAQEKIGMDGEPVQIDDLALGSGGEPADPFSKGRLQTALSQLPEGYREVLVMHDVLEMGHGEIASIMGGPGRDLQEPAPQGPGQDAEYLGRDGKCVMKPTNPCYPHDQLSAYLDEDLDPSLQEEVARHLEACETCRKVTAELGTLRDCLPALADAEPVRDLWPAVQRARQAQEQAGPVTWWRRFWMVPVSAVAGAAATVLIFLLVGLPSTESQKAPASPVRALQAVADAELEYRKAIDGLENALKATRPDWSPKTRQVVEQGLAEIDQTIQKYKAVLKDDAEDPEAQEAMLAAYQYKVDFLIDLVAESL